MSFSDPYLRERSENTDVSGVTDVATADSTTVTLVTAKTGWTVFVQRIHVYILTDAAQQLTFQDNNGTPKVVFRTDSAPGIDTPYHQDFGPKGRTLTEAKNFVMAITGAGLAAHVQYEAFMKQTGRETVQSGIGNNTGTGQQFA